MTDSARDGDPWGQWDETLADGAVDDGAQAAPDEARPWLLDQRFVHGLLRAWHTADASSQDARVERVLVAVAQAEAADAESIPVAVAGAGDRGRAVRSVGLIAAILAVAVGLWFGVRLLRGDDALPKAEAMVARAMNRMLEPVDRVFQVESGREGGRFGNVARSATVTIRPGRFLVEATVPFGRVRIGCDGDNLWFRGGERFPGMSVPLSEAKRFESMLSGVLELGYLDLQNLLARLPDDFRLETAGRESGLDGAGDRIRVVATGLPERLEGRVETADLWFEEDTGMVSEIHLVVRPRIGGERRLDVVYQGTTELPPGSYRMPE